MVTLPSKQEHFCSKKFVDDLFNEGVQVPCDDSVNSFQQNDVPDFYDELTFKRGQEFFHTHLFSLFFSKLLGLLSVLAVPSVIKILMFTKMSGNSMTAYKRYMSTILHMNIWYQSDFTPNSSIWKSIGEVKSKHNFASKRSCAQGISKINQRDMALTQFGFMGLAIARTEKIGIHNASKKDLEALIHVWRVVGYLMGIEDRFNICRESLKETQEICNLLIEKLLKPQIEKQEKDYLEMTLHLIDGMWTMNPILNHRVFLTYLHTILQDSNNNNNNNSDNYMYFSLNLLEKFHIKIVELTMLALKFTLVRWYLNMQHVISLWLMRNFPFLAIYSFGYPNSIITVLDNKTNKI